MLVVTALPGHLASTLRAVLSQFQNTSHLEVPLHPLLGGKLAYARFEPNMKSLGEEEEREMRGGGPNCGS